MIWSIQKEDRGNSLILEGRFKVAKREIYIILKRKPNCPTQLRLATWCNLESPEEKVPRKDFPDDIGLWACL